MTGEEPYRDSGAPTAERVVEPGAFTVLVGDETASFEVRAD